MMSGSKTDALPKRGHVNEVCKEWLVREDGALAYKLQSQEINDFYKGNRYRNEVVRTDFPQALEEQIKEKENAEKQKECYKKYLSEQEQHDKRVAMEIAEKLERDIQEQRQRELEESEKVADELQNIYVNLPIPTTTLEFPCNPYSENASIQHSSRDFTQAHNSQEVGIPLSFNPSNDFHPPMEHHSKNNRPKLAQNVAINDVHDRIANNISSARNTKHSSRPKHNSQNSSIPPLDNITQYTDHPESSSLSYTAAESSTRKTANNHSSSKSKRLPSSDVAGDLRTDLNFQNNFDHQLLVESSPRNRHQQQAQQHVDEIELYVDPNLQELGLPMEEIKEINKKMKQERRDEELARKLQEMEKLSSMTLEDRDRLLAIEAQDKELAKMLQEREKAKAKRAKEKARLRKQKETNSIHNGPLLPLPQDTQVPLSSQSEEIDQIDLEAYSNPKDLISNQRIQNESFTGSSLNSTFESAGNIKDDDIYTLPIDSCGSSGVVSNGQSPMSGSNHSFGRAEHYSLSDLQNDVHESLRMNQSISSSYEQNSGPAPPYMPIQGTRRSNSNDERKKRSKDKCTHQ